MSIATSQRTFHTPEELLTYADGKGFELVDGQFVELNVGSVSNAVGTVIATYITMFCWNTKLGLSHGDNMGYRLPGLRNTVRKPDASFIRRERLTPENFDVGYYSFAPDLAVEVVSPPDSADEVEAKILEYLHSGVRLVWVVFPKSRTVAIRRADGSASVLGINDEIIGEDVLPGFRLKVSEIFARADALT